MTDHEALARPEGRSREADREGGPAGRPPQTISSNFGDIVWLLTHSPLHRHLFLTDLEWLVMTPMLLNQYRLFRTPNSQPAGVALWALLSEEAEQRLEAGIAKLRPQDWRSGDRLWLVDLVAPFGGAPEMLADLKRSAFAGKTFRYHRMDPEGKRAVVDGAQPAPDGKPQP